jgi:hypothetical protein
MAIVQRVSLEGGDAVVRQLEAVGRSGQRAVENISNAAGKADFKKFEESLKSLGESSKQAFEKIGQIGNKLTLLFGVEIAEGIGGVVKSITELGKASAEAIDDVDDLGKQAGTTAQSMQAVLSVFRQTGAEVDGVGDKMRRFTVSVQKAWEDVKNSVKEAAHTQKEDQLNIEGATLSLEQANINLAKSYKEVSTAIGDPLKTEQALLNVRQNQLNVARAEQNVEATRRKAIEDEANSIERLRDAVLGLAEGKGDLSQVNVTAENLFKGIVAAAGPSIDTLKEMSTDFNHLASTTAPAAKNVLYLLADVFKNLKDETLKTAIATQAFGRNVDVDLIKALSRGSEAFKEREKELHDLGLAFDEADTKAADAFKESYGEFKDFLVNAKDKIGATFTPLYTTLAEGFTGLLKNNVASLKASAASFKDLFQPIVSGLANVLKGVSFEDFKKEAKEALSPEEYINIELWQNRFEVLKQGLGIVIDSFKTLKNIAVGVLNEIAALINKIFNTQISGEGLGITLLIARFAGLYTIIVKCVGIVNTLGRAITALATSPAALLNPWVLLAVAIGAVLLLIITHWDDIKKAGSDAADAIQAHWNVIKGWWTGLLEWMAKQWNEFWANAYKINDTVINWFKNLGATLLGYWSDFTAGLGQLIDDAINVVKQAFTSLSDWFKGIVQTMTGWWTDFVNWVKTTAASIEAKAKALASSLSGSQQASSEGAPASEAMAGGGLVHGAGTSTSDSVPARLSRGEFVVRAAAVRSVGVGFMHAINRAPGFAMGGLVDAFRDGLSSLAVPMAKGGPAPAGGGLRPFNLVMPGGGSYGGLFAQESAVTSLKRAAVGAQIAATGRRPAWVR